MMYDDNNLRRSEFYFSALESLRLFSIWIHETPDHLDALMEKCNQRLVYPLIEEKASVGVDEPGRSMWAAFVKIKSNWKEIQGLHRKQVNLFLNRIKKQTEEVKSLRDGVSETPTLTRRCHY
jgi:hypothetical protein